MKGNREEAKKKLARLAGSGYETWMDKAIKSKNSFLSVPFAQLSVYYFPMRTPQGYLSYPRTESSAYPPNSDLTVTCSLLAR